MRLRPTQEVQLSHMVLRGFNISKFSFDAGLMDGSNVEIFRENMFTKEVKYDTDAVEKSFKISVNLLKT